MNEIVNKYLLAGDKCMPEMHLKQTGFTYTACGSFTKNKERIQKFMQTGDVHHIYGNDLVKICFQHDMPYGSYEVLVKRTIKFWKLKHLKLQVIQNMMVMKED